MRPELHALVMERDELADLDPAARRLALRALVADAFEGESTGELIAEAADHIDGFGPLAEPMRASDVTDVLVNGAREIWVERSGRLERCPLAFADESELTSWIGRTVGAAGGRVDASHPIGDVRLPDGSRMHVVLPPLAPSGPVVSIRRFPISRPAVGDLVEAGTLTASQAEELVSHVVERQTIAITGGTGAGKTTLLNALLGHVLPSERVVLIEETAELRPACAHVVSLVARPPNLEGGGAVGLESLFRAALRMRPDRIVVGEVRGSEALVALDAMSTGHDGSLVTIHARSARDAVERMVALAGRAGGRDEKLLADRFTRAFDVVVHLERSEGRRVVSDILEIE